MTLWILTYVDAKWDLPMRTPQDPGGDALMVRNADNLLSGSIYVRTMGTVSEIDYDVNDS